MLPTSKSVNEIQHAIGPYEDLLTIVKRRKLQWYGHVSRSLGLAKTILQSTVRGGRRQGGQGKRWEDNIRNRQAWSSASPRGQWRTGENGENWLPNHLWCPNDPRVKGMMIMMMYCGHHHNLWKDGYSDEELRLMFACRPISSQYFGKKATSLKNCGLQICVGLSVATMTSWRED